MKPAWILSLFLLSAVAPALHAQDDAAEEPASTASDQDPTNTQRRRNEGKVRETNRGGMLRVVVLFRRMRQLVFEDQDKGVKFRRVLFFSFSF